MDTTKRKPGNERRVEKDGEKKSAEIIIEKCEMENGDEEEETKQEKLKRKEERRGEEEEEDI